ncbi:MAG: ribonuclease HI [Chitinispirillaceae bacterium]|nr:ribonuclease HI [Chitinispirillaceae bacterium]
MKEVTIYSDGACSGNPGPGGYGVILSYKGKEKELSGGFSNTTNNRMELMAVIVGLEALKEPCKVTVVTDSRYVVDGIEKGWINKWKANGWKRSDKERVANIDLWERLLKAMSRHQVKFIWIQGHNGHPQNERCDKLAVESSNKPNLPSDIVKSI